MNPHRQHADMISIHISATERRAAIAMAIAIGIGLAAVLVAWWS